MQKVKETPYFDTCNVAIIYAMRAYPLYDRIINRKLKRYADTGSDFSNRDMCYSFKTLKGALSFASKANAKIGKLKYVERIVVYDSNADIAKLYD